MENLDKLMQLRKEASQGNFSINEINDNAYEVFAGDEYICNIPIWEQNTKNVNYIIAACNVVPELVQRIKELESKISYLTTNKS